jgi:glycosyltransferase involved in cell wall biosynthesis
LTVEKVLARVATDRIVVISRQQFREIHEQFGVGRREQFRVIPLGLDVEAFAEWRERRAAARAELGARDELLVGIVGRLTEIKNHQLFLAAAALYLKRQAGAIYAADESASQLVRFIIVGDGHLRDQLEATARSLGIEAHVIFTGLRDDPKIFMLP